jgi:hypothetical protein
MIDLLNRMWVHISAQSPLAIVITMLLLLVIFILWYETYKQRLDWRDLITNPATNRVSLTKLLQLVGGVVGTWIMVVVTLQGKLSPDLFFTYLAYVGAIEGWSKFITAKYGAPTDRAYPRPQVGRYNQGYNPGYTQGYDQGYDDPHIPQYNRPQPQPPAAKPPIGDDV